MIPSEFYNMILELVEDVGRLMKYIETIFLRIRVMHHSPVQFDITGLNSR